MALPTEVSLHESSETCTTCLEVTKVTQPLSGEGTKDCAGDPPSWGPSLEAKALAQPHGEEDTTDCDGSTASGSDLASDSDLETDTSAEAHEAAMRRISLVAETPLDGPVRTHGCLPLQMVERMKFVLGVDFVTSQAFTWTLRRAFQLLYAVEYTSEEVYATVAHACALAKRCPEAITEPFRNRDVRTGTERVVALLALAMIDIDDEACELVTWRVNVLPHTTATRMDCLTKEMLGKIGWNTHVRVEAFEESCIELGLR